jgi:hypothetical protein
MKVALWIHCLTHLILAATLVFYLDHLQKHLLYLSQGKVYLPVVTHYAFRWRSFLWLTPLAFAAVAFLIARLGVTPDRYAIFSACSSLVIVSLIGIIVLVTCAPFLYHALIERPADSPP